MIADLADLQALLRACMALRDSHKALINVNLTSGKSYSQAQRMVMSKRVVPGVTMVTQRLREALSTGHARIRTVFADFADAVVSAQSNAWRRFRDLLAAFLLFAYWKR